MTAASAGQWRLPPQQCILEPPETEFDLDRVATELTIVMSTSVSNFTPSTDTPVAALESLQSNVAFRWCRKILVFDQVPSEKEVEKMRQDGKAFHHVARAPKWVETWNSKRSDYWDYCEKLKAMLRANHPALFKVEMVFLPKFGHLYGTVKEALDQVKTRFVFVTQHDLRLSGKFVASDVQNILEALDQGIAKYVNLNRDSNSSDRTRSYFALLPSISVRDETKRPSGLSLTAMAGFSDQAHFAEADWYREKVLAAIPLKQRLTCMEHILHDPWKEAPEWKGTFLYGGTDEGPFVLDLIYGLQVWDHTGQLRRLPPPPTRVAE